jgi:EAL domain-containing protein (putative c-di-GMP-specific phosphodiesterase class I)/GGDEF domain-containing protein
MKQYNADPDQTKIIKDLDNLYNNIDLRESKNYSLAIVNINRFKNINAIMGVEVGDKVINLVYSELTRISGDFPVIHLYADNFIFLTNKEESSVEVSNQLIRVFEDTFEFSKSSFYINISIGITTEEKSTALTTALYNAEAALLNKNVVSKQIHIHDPKNKEKHSFNYLQVERNAREAIEQGGFFLHLQPKVDQTGKVQGAEALCRWELNDKILYPDSFIDEIESTWLISSLTKKVIDLTLESIVELDKVGVRIPISFNMSPKVFVGDSSILPYLESKQAENPDAFNFLEMEILETTELSDPIVFGNLEKLKKLGCNISLDDFGTGYASISYLTKYPISNLKIDKSMLDNLESNSTKVILQVVIDMCNALKLKSVFEGVERKEEAQFLFDSGADLIQGYYFSKPVVIADFIELAHKESIYPVN